MSEKKLFREQLKERRAAIPPNRKKEMDAAIIRSIAASPAFREASAILLYAPHGSEINLLPLVRIARQRGIPVAFPRCNTEDCTMQFVLLSPEARLSPGAYGILEPPADAPLCPVDEKTLCILPALSFDRTGARIGYGKGYYDRFLRDFPGITLGAVYAELLSDSIPTEPHDRPVSRIVTERGTLRPTKGRPPLPPAADKLIRRARARVIAWRQGLPQRKDTATTASHATPDRPPTAPLLLVLSVYLLLLISRLVDARLADRNNEFAVVILLQVLTFAFPAVLYAKLRGAALIERTRMRAPRPEHLWFLFCVLVVMMSGSLLTAILTGGISSLSGGFTLYDTFIARSDGSLGRNLYLVLAYALLPAFCEELVFRSFLCAEYERYGVGAAMTVSSLFFAMLHFSLPLFVTYFCMGLLLCCAMYATRSFFAAPLLHLLYNLFCLFGQPYLSAFYLHAGSNEIFIFCLVTVFLLFSAFAAGEARKIYHLYAVRHADVSYTTPLPLRELPRTLLQLLATPACVICVLLWLAVSIVGLL